MKFVIHKAITLLVLTGMLLSACGSNLWGIYNPPLTPTAGTSTPTMTNGIDPTATATPDPVVSLAPSPTPDFPTPTMPPADTPTPVITPGTARPTIAYVSQSGDSLDVVAIHFGVQPSEIMSSSSLPTSGFLDPGTTLFIPDRLAQTPTTPSQTIIPDSELVDSPTAVGFDIHDYINQAGGKLSTLKEYMNTVGTLTGADGVIRISLGSSISPRLILALIQYYTGYVQGTPTLGVDEKYPLGYSNPNYSGLYQQLRLAIMDLLTGYYGWRAGDLTELTFPDGTELRIAPDLNAGTVALQYYFSTRLNNADWKQAIDSQAGFMALYRSMFGDPWVRANELGPLFPPNLTQPTFTLPFEVGAHWNFTSGPHPAWDLKSALAALDFAPAGVVLCGVSNAWVLAMTGGKIVRSGDGYVMLDMDGDGFEQTGWVVLYMHIRDQDRVPVGTWVNTGDRIGHPSCEGGEAIGTHTHIARKYNGEWVDAGGPLPFVMSGWTVHAGSQPRQGTMTKGDLVITVSFVGSHESLIIRKPGE